MASIGSVSLPRPGAHANPRRVVRAGLAGFALSMLLALLALAAASVAIGVMAGDRAMPGVRVAGVDIGGLDREAAVARLRSSLPSIQAGSLLLVVDGTQRRIGFGELGRHYDYAASVASGLAVGRSGNPLDDALDRLRAAAGIASIEPVIQAADAVALDRLVISTVSRHSRPTVDASVAVSPRGTYVVMPAQPGLRLDPATLRGALLAALAAETPRQPVTLSAAVQQPSVSTAEAIAAAEAARAMAVTPLVLSDGHDTFRVAAADLRSVISFGPADGAALRARVDAAGVRSLIARLATTVNRAPRNATYGITSTGVSGVVPSLTGRKLDVDRTTAAALAALKQRAGGGSPGTVALGVTVTQPALSTEAAKAAFGQLQLIGSWTTYYFTSEGNGWGANISIPAQDLDGKVLAPGEWLDFWRDIGPVTEARGYTWGGAIIGGRSVKGGALAGGICSTSTTLFNAALRAGLNMGARANHYYYIDRYPLGLDATVIQADGWSQTMSFQNDTAGPIMIRSLTGPGFVRFDLWGLPTNRIVSFSTPVISHRTSSTDTVQYTSALPTGVRQRVEYPHDGFDAVVSRTVRDAITGRVIHFDTYFSAYQRVTGITLVGGPAPGR